jgi:hypothetical protein
LKLTALFVSPSIAVRGVTWLITFLLLTVLWILLLRFLPLDGLFHYLGTIGMTGAQTIMAITLLPPLVMSLLSWVGLQALSPPTAAPNVTVANPAPETILAPATEKLRIAAWSAVTPFGDASATAASSQEQDKIFGPDSAIRNAEGHPVHAATVKELPLELLNYPVETRSRAMRVSAMLVTVLNSLFEQQIGLARSAPSTTVYWLLPEALPLDNETRLSFSMAWTHSFWRNGEYDLHLLPAASESVYGALNSLPQHMSPSKRPYVLLLAADSLVSPDELLAPLALGQIFSNKIPDGFVPAEGAAGLLLVDAVYATASNLVGLCTLGAVQLGQRATDRGTPGKVDSSALTTCITEAMTATKTTAGEVGVVISDTDHRLPRSLEVIQAMEQMLPELDPLTQRITPMAFAGNFGAASDLIHLALAADMAVTIGQTALTVNVTHARQTAAVMITPDTV